MDAKLVDKIVAYLKTVPVEKAWIFGSFSRGEETPASDVDILVEFVKDSKIGMEYFHMINDWEEICGRDVDLAGDDMLEPRVVPYVNKDKILIYERKIERQVAS